LDQFTDCGSETFPCRPSGSYPLRAILRTGPHCIGPKTTFDALNSRKPSCFSRWFMWIVRVTRLESVVGDEQDRVVQARA